MSLIWTDSHGVEWIRIQDVDRMPPFLASVVSPSDHWLYVSSRGGLTAGRRSPDGAVFPYLTDDRLHRAHHDQGPWTLVRVAEVVWEPFRPRAHAGIRRHLRKSVAGDQLVFEEEHLALGLVFAYRWAPSERFGWVRTCTLAGPGLQEPVDIELVDGLQGVLPAGVPLSLTQTSSCLVDAYTRTQWDAQGRLALVSLEAQPSDRAEPAEALRATVAWCEGLEPKAILLSRDQLDDIARGAAPRHEDLVTGRAGAFLVSARVHLEPRGSHTWHVVVDGGRSHLDVSTLRERGSAGLSEELEAEVRASRASLEGILADVDGLQHTADPVLDAHIQASALFNAMRGGVPLDEHRVSTRTFETLVAHRNRACHHRHAAWLEGLGDTLEVGELLTLAEERQDPDLLRLAHELLPLWFGRRHGDPSRPWNRFDIRVRDEEGKRILAWQGNWRDVFQNWEALLLAYPELIESVIAVFLSASTRDGYNPYRITSEGVDWEQPEPENPWANLGYWGDHQISYLTRLLELSLSHHPGRLQSRLGARFLASADVPYRLRPHEQLLQDPRDAIVFDHAAQRVVEEREARLGADGRLVHDGDAVLHLSLAEKLLVPTLAKLCALVPGAGIWMNTQRPEWNDANNALAGYGVSVVTAAYLRRHLAVLEQVCADRSESLVLSGPAARWLREVLAILASDPPATWSNRSRRQVMDALGQAATAYRQEIYGNPPARWLRCEPDLLRDLCGRGQRWLDDALEAALRPDGLYDGYDLVEFAEGAASVHRLYPMLEGQVAMLSSGALSSEQAAALVERMYASPLYREDVHSFLLYPIRELPSFVDKNRVPEGHAAEIGLASGLLSRDAQGVLRFDPDLHNASDLEQRLDATHVDIEERQALLDLWEATFHHHAFTGRSGTMHAYEGLGSVYWHMVGKLLLAVQEAWTAAEGAEAERLAGLYHRVRQGLGYHHTPAEFGAFPTDPYSHTPAGRGAQQPGMTGLVKEELIARRGELGVLVRGGRLGFDPCLLDPAELLDAPTSWTVPAGVRPGRQVQVPAGGLAFLLCGVPVIYRASTTDRVRVHAGGEVLETTGRWLGEATSQRVFRRDPTLHHVVVELSNLGSTT